MDPLRFSQPDQGLEANIMRTGFAVLHGQRQKVAFQLLDQTDPDCGVLVVDRPDFFAPGDVFMLEPDRGQPLELIVNKIRSDEADALVAFSASAERV